MSDDSGQSQDPRLDQSYLSQTPTIPAYYVLTAKIKQFRESLGYLAKFTDMFLFEFGERSLYFEAYSATKSSHVFFKFEDEAIQDWDFGDFANSPDRRLQLPAKQIVGSLRGIKKGDTLTLSINNRHNEKLKIKYDNRHEVARIFELSAREIPVVHKKLEYSRVAYSNRIACPKIFFNKLFNQLSDTDEMSFQFFPTHSIITKYINEGDEDKVSTLHSMQAADQYDLYVVNTPMLLIVSVRELKNSLKLIGVFSAYAIIYFDLLKPMLVSFDDEDKSEKCEVVISCAGVRELTDEELEGQSQQATQHQTIASQSRTFTSNNDFVQEDEPQHGDFDEPQRDEFDEPQQEDDFDEPQRDIFDEPPTKQRRKSKPFSFEDTPHESNPISPEDFNAIHPCLSQTGFGRQSSVASGENRSYQQQSFDFGASPAPIANNESPQQDDASRNVPHQDNFNDYDMAPSPAASAIPTEEPQTERKSTSPYLLALKLLGIEDQLSDPEGPDYCETYDLPATDPEEDLYQASQRLSD